MAKKSKKEGESEGEVKPGRTGGLAEHLRKSIGTCGLSQYEIAQRAGIAPQQIYRFMNDDKTLTLETVDKLIPVIDESFALRMMGVRFANDQMSSIRENMIGYIGQLQDAIEDLKAMVIHGPVKDGQ